jgi:hypothetical protein
MFKLFRRVERLVLGRGGHLPLHRQISKKRLDFRLSASQIFPAAHPMELHVALDPIQVGSLRMDGIMMQPQDRSYLIEQPRFIRLSGFAS